MKSLAAKARSGLLIKGNTRTEVIKKLNFEKPENTLKNFMTLIEILDLLAQSA